MEVSSTGEKMEVSTETDLVNGPKSSAPFDFFNSSAATRRD